MNELISNRGVEMEKLRLCCAPDYAPGHFNTSINILGWKLSNVRRILTLKIHANPDIIIKAPKKFQEDWPKIRVNMKIITFASIFSPNCYCLITPLTPLITQLTLKLPTQVFTSFHLLNINPNDSNRKIWPH